MAADASARSYFRLLGSQPPLLLMDMGGLTPLPYLRVAAHLQRLRLRVPRIFAADCIQGLVLLEDLGEATFTRLLAEGADEAMLYRLAIAQLLRLHGHVQATTVAVPHYEQSMLLEEAGRLVLWLLPVWRGRPATSTERDSYRRAWERTLEGLPSPVCSLVLLDFHVDNLMRLDNGQCALLDFQDARIGPTAYDVMSLLEDARRDVTPAVARAVLDHYLGHLTGSARESFERWYAVLAAQRHSKVLGLFVRLCVRDGKCGYLAHVPRVQRLLAGHLSNPALTPVRNWLEHHLPEWKMPLSKLQAAQPGVGLGFR